MSKGQKIKILVADDHAILRSGLRMLINSQQDMEVVADAPDGFEAARLAKERRPHIALLDITMAGGGTKALEQILASSPETRVLILTMHDDVAYLRSVLAAGASGYVLKRAVDADLLSAIRAVHRGGTFVDPVLADTLAEPAIGPGKKRAGKNLLSQRELQVLELVAQGHSSKQIADRILVSVKTVETYRARIASKLGLKSRSDMVKYALEFGLLTAEKVATGE
jgi:two-component system response regulator NreC